MIKFASERFKSLVSHHIFPILILSFFSLDAKDKNEAEQSATFLTCSSEVIPYLLPDEHPIKDKLDVLFSRSRVLLCEQTMEDAGFLPSKPRKWDSNDCDKASAFSWFCLQAYLDKQRYYKDMPEYHWWIIRIIGAEKIRRVIEDRGFNHLFKVPRKWIYALPNAPNPIEGYFTKHFLLVEEDMEIFDDQTNEEMWQSDLVTIELLSSLYDVLETFRFTR